MYGPCIDCGNPARNKCGKCRRNYCATCRNVSGSKTCGKCRAAAKLATQQSKVAQSQSSGAAAPSYAPGTTSWMPQPQPLPSSVAAPMPQPLPAKRSTLNAMDDAEFVAWQSATVSALRDVQSRTSRSATDSAMERDLILFADLLDALGELKAAHDVMSSSGSTGALLSYDASQASFTSPPDDDDDDDDDTIDFYAHNAQPKP